MIGITEAQINPMRAISALREEQIREQGGG